MTAMYDSINAEMFGMYNVLKKQIIVVLAQFDQHSKFYEKDFITIYVSVLCLLKYTSKEVVRRDGIFQKFHKT